MNVSELRTKLDELLAKEQRVWDRAADQKRDLTEEEMTEVEGIQAETKTAQRQLDLALASAKTRKDLEKPAEEPEKVNPGEIRTTEVGQDRKELEPFKDFGENMRAIYRACKPGGEIDARLAAQQRAASGANESVPSDGGFLVQKDFSAEILKRMYETGVLASRARRIPVSGNGLKINAIDESSRTDGNRWGGVQAYWTNEAESLTGSKPKFRQIELTLNKLTALFYATEEVLADTTALGAIAGQAFSEELAFKLDDAILRGAGAGQPLGILESGALVSVAKETNQAASTILVENIVKMWSRLYGRSRANAAWFINQDIEPQLHTMTLAVGTGGVPVYMPANGISGSPFGTLYGRPVVPIEHASTLGTQGDIGLFDLAQYILIEKGGVQSDSSIHVRFVNDEVTFRYRVRADGQPWWSSALTPYKGSNTQSPFVVLDTRS